jgi:hypothetical protein
LEYRDAFEVKAMAVLTLPVSFGDAADRITILEIKKEHMVDAAKRVNVVSELELISAPFFRAIEDTPKFRVLFARLKEINETLWKIEDDIRECERRNDFGAEFVHLARAVYITNDDRARVKGELNILLGSAIVEEKSYADHGRDPR